MSDLVKVSAIISNQCQIISELNMHLRELRPDMESGLFCISNTEAFAIAKDVVDGLLLDLKPHWIESLSLAYKDILRISEADLESINSLEELDLPVEELLEYIDAYDKRASEWDYSLEDMRRVDFLGLFCTNCDQEIGNRDCTNCATNEEN